MPVQVKIGMQKLFIDAFSKPLKKLRTVTHFAYGQDVLSDNGSRLSDLFSICVTMLDYLPAAVTQKPGCSSSVTEPN